MELNSAEYNDRLRNVTIAPKLHFDVLLSLSVHYISTNTVKHSIVTITKWLLREMWKVGRHVITVGNATSVYTVANT